MKFYGNSDVRKMLVKAIKAWERNPSDEAKAKVERIQKACESTKNGAVITFTK